MTSFILRPNCRKQILRNFDCHSNTFGNHNLFSLLSASFPLFFRSGIVDYGYFEFGICIVPLSFLSASFIKLYLDRIVDWCYFGIVFGSTPTIVIDSFPGIITMAAWFSNHLSFLSVYLYSIALEAVLQITVTSKVIDC